MALMVVLAISVLAAGGLVVWNIRRNARRRERRELRRRRNVAYQRAWDWLMRRDRSLRLEHHQTED